MAKRWDSARTCLIGGGAVYLVLWIYGLVIDRESAANFVPVNDAETGTSMGTVTAVTDDRVVMALGN